MPRFPLLSINVPAATHLQHPNVIPWRHHFIPKMWVKRPTQRLPCHDLLSEVVTFNFPKGEITASSINDKSATGSPWFLPCFACGRRVIAVGPLNWRSRQNDARKCKQTRDRKSRCKAIFTFTRWGQGNHFVKDPGSLKKMHPSFVKIASEIEHESHIVPPFHSGNVHSDINVYLFLFIYLFNFIYLSICLFIYIYIIHWKLIINSGLPALVLRMIQSLRERTNGIAGLPLVRSVGLHRLLGKQGAYVRTDRIASGKAKDRIRMYKANFLGC
jgi:hypothetical protein